jgi:DNA-binding HxlR family transcriptional regulator
MTTQPTIADEKLDNGCPAERLLKLMAGKWKPQIFYLAINGPIRFNYILRHIEGANKQTIAVALKELEAEELLTKVIVQLKPLHIEYNLSEKGKSLIPVFRQLELLS